MKLQQPETLILDHRNVQFPDAHKRPPRTPYFQKLFGSRTDRWQRTAKILWLVASGYSLAKEIRELVAAAQNGSSSSGAIRDRITQLIDDGVLLATKTQMNGKHSMYLLALGPESQRIIEKLKWQPVETEWQRMLRLHEKGKQSEERHTLAVIAFVYQARLRGYAAGVMPPITGFEPDAVVLENQQPVYVEVERSYKYKDAKWERMAEVQGFVAICANTPKHRERLIAENDWHLDIPGRATDLSTLRKTGWQEPYGPLWLEDW